MKRIFLIIIVIMMFGCASQQQQPSVSIEPVNPDANESLIELVNVLVEQMAEKSTFTLQVKASTYEGAQLFQVFFLRRPIADEEDEKDVEEKAEQSAVRK